ncbi:MAG: hypothetical protein KJ710_01095 [Candidatus Omnitrophica bacterium]|nr:hypothetical protein [Candidatus Omnitrophota bacterium]MBU1922846.1 hypothetical protein [Candidatus Omnitrophota bacterium]
MTAGKAGKVSFKKGQNLTEAVVIIGIVGLVFVGMQVYVKRGVQGKVKDLTDNMIGTEQEAYQEDTSGLEINESASTFTSSSTIASNDSLGGAKSLIANEATTVTYSSESTDAY